MCLTEQVNRQNAENLVSFSSRDKIVHLLWQKLFTEKLIEKADEKEAV